MKSLKLMLSPQRWYAMRVIPELRIGWSGMEATPVLITGIKPLKTGKNLMRLSLIPLLYPEGPKEITTDYRVIHHHESHLVTTAADYTGKERTWIFEEVGFEWLSKHAQKVMTKINSASNPSESPQKVLSEYFGGSLQSMTSIASPLDYPGENRLSPMPEQRAYLSLNREYSEYDSYLISKGFIPHEMEEKWLIYRKEDRLYFHRSWTGYCIYEVALGHREGRLYTSHGYVNRDSRQYTATDDSYDAAMVYYLIDVFLLDKPAAFPQTFPDPA